MGLTKNAVGKFATENDSSFQKFSSDSKVIALAGNPNVGKSTIFNALTGMNQHTGNWPGKTVSNAKGYFSTQKNDYILVDLPGTYSLMAHSTEEEIARNFICFDKPDAVIVVCDATCLERNLNLVLQTLEITQNVIVCINLMDEAKRKKIKINLKKISDELKIPVVGTSAKSPKTLKLLTDILDNTIENTISAQPYKINYPEDIETAINILQPSVSEMFNDTQLSRWFSIRLLDADTSLEKEMCNRYGDNILKNENIILAENYLIDKGIDSNSLEDQLVTTIYKRAEDICKNSITYEKTNYSEFDQKIDRIITGKHWAVPIMILFLTLILWITITGANIPSKLLSDFLFSIQDKLSNLLITLGVPMWIEGILVQGVYRVLAWVVSVMLPPMAIFFPLFTLLEDIGYLPRIAYNLDKPFNKCKACGKQALTMCMGFGCNAAGVVGCRIIDSPRERMLAILTNSFVPCNGRFPALIAIITMFFIGTNNGLLSSVSSAFLLTVLILFGIISTFVATKILSKTLLKGFPSSFTLEMPPYRKPQIGKVIVRSIFDRTLFVLGRAASVAAPTGAIIWLMANLTINNITLLKYCSDFLNPLAHIMGMDGVILLAFILGFPANEIVIPIIIMAYMSQNTITDFESLAQLKDLFVQNGWTWVTAINTMIFSILHWPCSTTVLTIKKETGSWKWTALGVILPTLFGIVCCVLFTSVANFL